jgi:uncharacterized membrane protein
MNEDKLGEIEIIISQSLRIGVFLCSAIILAGLIMLLMTGNSGYPAGYYPYTPTDIFHGALLLKPSAIIMVGLLILIGIPVFRVGVSVIVFYKEKDYLYVKTTATVFVILIISLFMGKGG